LITREIFNSKAQALVNFVNLQGVSGPGLAAACKKQFPQNFGKYKKLCKEEDYLLYINIGRVFATVEPKGSVDKSDLIIYNLPTRFNYDEDQRVLYFKMGLEHLEYLTQRHNIGSIAIELPEGLDHNETRPLIEKHLSHLEVEVYEHNNERNHKKRVPRYRGRGGDDIFSQDIRE
jgi:hypothetical protein